MSFSKTSTLALGPTQPPIQWVPEALLQVVKQPAREADYSSPSSAEVKNECTCPHLGLRYAFSAGTGTTLLVPLYFSLFHKKN